MRTIVTGTVGLDKRHYLEQVVRYAAAQGQQAHTFHVGQRMYAEAADVTHGRILDVSASRLAGLRRSIFKDLLNTARDHNNIIVNTHATFRWKHGLFPAFDFDQIAAFGADLYICLLDSVDAVHCRLMKEHQVDHSLKDLLVWREEETLATQLMMEGAKLARPGHIAPPRFYVLALGSKAPTIEAFYRLMFRHEMPKAYLSFPMTHVAAMDDVLAEIEVFRTIVGREMIVFDPGDLEEQDLYVEAVNASQEGKRTIEVYRQDQWLRFDVAEVLQAAGDIHAQIYARDFMLIDQADMIISYIPEMNDGKPGLSSGVERELQHAHEAAKEVYVIWKPSCEPSPFITETATKVFKSIDAAMEAFEAMGYCTKGKRHPGTLFPT